HARHTAFSPERLAPWGTRTPPRADPPRAGRTRVPARNPFLRARERDAWIGFLEASMSAVIHKNVAGTLHRLTLIALFACGLAPIVTRAARAGEIIPSLSW